MNVARFIKEKNLDSRIVAALKENGFDLRLPDSVAELPVQKTRAVTRFGSYVVRNARPVAIRLQFALPEDELIETFLHELAHCLDHLTNQKGRSYRQAHGDGWKKWAAAFGIAPASCGKSATLHRLREQRLKVVAICQKCGFEVRRLRRFPRRRKYLHIECGGKLRLL